MGKMATVVEHYEAELKAKDAIIAAHSTANSRLQAAINQAAPDTLDAEDKSAFAVAAARFGLPNASAVAAPAVPAVVEVPPIVPVVATVSEVPTVVSAVVPAVSKFVPMPDPK